ncbi:MAG: hypothetical protein IPO06_17355 [Leptospiraceae bacterium]|nr:hypothetical protein [Leptospiraceae bacterium]MBK9501099.1 hypothetical protein [Leptospiraceae bacterium]
MDKKIRDLLKKLDRQKTFIQFIECLVQNHELLKSNYKLEYTDDNYGDVYQFNFYKKINDEIKLKFELLNHIMNDDENNQIDKILKKLGWFEIHHSGLGLTQLIDECLNELANVTLSKNQFFRNKFRNFEYNAWQSFLNILKE